MTLQRLALVLNYRYHFSTCSPVISITHPINHGKIKASMGSSETVTGGMWRMALSNRNGGRNGWSYIYIHIAASTTPAQAPSFLSRHWKHADTASGYSLKANTVLLYALDSDARIY